MPEEPNDNSQSQPEVIKSINTNTAIPSQDTAPSAESTVAQDDIAGQPKKKSKKLVIIAIIMALLLAIIGGSAFAFNAIYQNPQKVLSDAMVQAMAAEKYVYTGNIAIKNDEFDIVATLNSKQDGVESGSLGLSVSVTLQEKTYSMTTDVLVDKNGDMFFKLSDIKGLINEIKSLLGMTPGSMLVLSIDNLVNKMDSEWVKISKSDIEKYGLSQTSTQTCIQGALSSIYSDEAVMKEITDLYQAHPFVDIESELGQQNGSIGYQIKGNESELKSFVIGLKDNSVYKALRACDSSIAIDENDLDFSGGSQSDTGASATLKVWIDYWTHKFTKVELVGESDGTDISMTILPEFNSSITVDTPSEFITPSELEDYIMNIWTAYAYEFSYQDYSQYMDTGDTFYEFDQDFDFQGVMEL